MAKCFLIGHRDAPSSLYDELLAQLERHVTELGVDEFLVGSYGDFDHLAAKALSKVKKFHPEVRLTMLLAYHPAERKVHVPSWFDGSLYPPNMERVPKRLAIVYANRYALSVSSFLIAYAWQPGSNTVKIVGAAAHGRKGTSVTVIGRHG